MGRSQGRGGTNAAIVGLQGVKVEEETREGGDGSKEGTEALRDPKAKPYTQEPDCIPSPVPGPHHCVSEAGVASISWGLQCERDADPGNRTGWILQHTGHV